MKRITGILSLAGAILLGAAGCCSPHQSGAAALQGSWSGREIGANPETPRRLVISGTQFDYRGAAPDDWGKGPFTLREDTQPRQLVVTLTECGAAQYIGTTCCLIYKIEDGILTLAGNEPGDPAAPLSFESPGARHMVFKKE
jgi:uncharacterized protein (TIGR03067 family)